jgi:hypothetical protein
MTSRARDAHTRVVAALHQSRNGDGGWPYYRGKQSRLEPTAWALLGTTLPVEATPLPAWAAPGGLLVEPSTRQVNYAFNALAALSASAERERAHELTRRIVRALVDARGVVIDSSPVIRQDTTLQGWSWTAGTFTWVEPTAWCMIALKQWAADFGGARLRLDVAERVMRDRACAGGGWNFGNGIVYGQALPAHVPPTAVGVLALQDQANDPLVTAALAHLEQHALLEGSTMALALSVIAVLAVGRSVDALVPALIERCASAQLTSNVATLGMAACALDAVVRGGRPRGLALPRGASA